MLKILHRINKTADLKRVSLDCGVEVDVRSFNNKLILNHEPFCDGEFLDAYLATFRHAFIVLEIKEEGIEREVIKLCEKHRIQNYFLLSVSFPFIYMLSKAGIEKMAVRFSEFESMSTCLSLQGKIEWIWIDTFTRNPLDKEVYNKLKTAGFKLCLVSPERWGRANDITHYKNYLKTNKIHIDAIMTEERYTDLWDD